MRGSYLLGVEVNRDHEGGSSGARPHHCTEMQATPTISLKEGNSGALFLVVGDCVRAFPLLDQCIKNTSDTDQ